MTLNALPDQASEFTGWSGSGCSGTGPCEVTMSAAHTVTATFALLPPPTHELTVAKAGAPADGTVTSVAPHTGIDCGPTCAHEFPAGSDVTLNALPDQASEFTGWSGSGCSGTGPCEVTMSAAHTVTATFALLPPPTHELTVAKAGAPADGTVTSVAPHTGIDCGPTCSHEFPAGSDVTLNALPDQASEFTGWSGSGCSGTGPCEVTMSAAHTVTATFALLPPPTHELTVAKAGAPADGTVTSVAPHTGIDCGPTCAHEFPAGSDVTLNALPDQASEFTGWSGSGCSGTGPCEVTMSAAHTVTATFALLPPPTHELTVAKAGAPADGTVISAPTGIDCGPTCSHDFAAGSDVTLTATADTGSTFTGWSGSGISCSGTGTCTVALNADEIVTATFNSVPAGDHALSVAKTGNGSGTVTSTPAGIACGTTCSAAFPAGSSVTLTAAPAAGAAFAGWSGAGCSGTGTCVVTMSADQSVTATFNLTTATPTLSVAKTGNGSGTVTSAPAGIACGTTCSAGLPAGSSVTLTAEPDQGSELTGWSGSGISCPGTGPCVVAMNADQSVIATFNPVVLKPFPRANVSYPNAAIVTFGADHYVFAGGRAFQASASELAAVQKVDPAKVVAAPGGTPAPIAVAPRPGVTVFTQPVNGNVTIYVIGTDGELHPFATPTQFFRDGYNGPWSSRCRTWAASPSARTPATR